MSEPQYVGWEIYTRPGPYHESIHDELIKQLKRRLAPPTWSLREEKKQHLLFFHDATGSEVAIELGIFQVDGREYAVRASSTLFGFRGSADHKRLGVDVAGAFPWRREARFVMTTGYMSMVFARRLRQVRRRPKVQRRMRTHI